MTHEALPFRDRPREAFHDCLGPLLREVGLALAQHEHADVERGQCVAEAPPAFDVLTLHLGVVHASIEREVKQLQRAPGLGRRQRERGSAACAEDDGEGGVGGAGAEFADAAGEGGGGLEGAGEEAGGAGAADAWGAIEVRGADASEETAGVERGEAGGCGGQGRGRGEGGGRGKGRCGVRGEGEEKDSLEELFGHVCQGEGRHDGGGLARDDLCSYWVGGYTANVMWIVQSLKVVRSLAGGFGLCVGRRE